MGWFLLKPWGSYGGTPTAFLSASPVGPSVVPVQAAGLQIPRRCWNDWSESVLSSWWMKPSGHLVKRKQKVCQEKLPLQAEF